jgi:hypothetical protein
MWKSRCTGSATGDRQDERHVERLELRQDDRQVKRQKDRQEDRQVTG